MLPAHREGPFDRAHGPECAEWASWARSGEQDASKGNIILIVLLPACLVGRDPAYKAGFAGHMPVKAASGKDSSLAKRQSSFFDQRGAPFKIEMPL